MTVASAAWPPTHEDMLALVREKSVGADEPVPGFFLECRCGEHENVDQGEEYCEACARKACAEEGLDPEDYTEETWGETERPRYCVTCGAHLEAGDLLNSGIDEELDHFETYGLSDSPNDWQAIGLVLRSLTCAWALEEGGERPGWMSVNEWEKHGRRWRRLQAVIAASMFGTTSAVARSLGFVPPAPERPL